MKSQEKKKTSISTPASPTVVELQTTPSPRPPILPDSYQGSDWSRKLTDLCAQYSSGSFYVAELIPQMKLENALKHYPLNGGGRVIALIDAAVFASAENGMLICEYGLSWHHWACDTKISSMSWKEFSKLTISINGTKIKIGNDAIFETDGTYFDKNKIKSLLVHIGELYLTNALNQLGAEGEATQNIPPSPALPQSSKLPKLNKTNVNCADLDSLLALPGIGVADAKLIIQHRDSNGPLASIDDLAAVLELKPHIVERLRPHVIFSLATANESDTPIPPKAPDSLPKNEPIDHRQHGPVRAPVDF